MMLLHRLRDFKL